MKILRRLNEGHNLKKVEIIEKMMSARARLHGEFFNANSIRAMFLIKVQSLIIRRKIIEYRYLK